MMGLLQEKAPTFWLAIMLNKIDTSHITLYQGDLPEGFSGPSDWVAIDTESMGLKVGRDRLCLVQLSYGDGKATLVKILPNQPSPHLKFLMESSHTHKLFHFARADVAMITHGLNCEIKGNVFCTKIASKLARTFTDAHGLSALVKDFCGIDLPKEIGRSDWGKETLSQEQMIYAANDVLYLHRLKKALEGILLRENRLNLAHEAFKVPLIFSALSNQNFDPDFVVAY